MLFTTGIAVSGLSGSIGGITAARNRFGPYFRSRTVPVNPNTNRQVLVRAVMAFLAEAWRDLPMTEALRVAWATYAASFNWTNRMGQSVNLTGFNAFVQGNAALIAAGGSLITAGPETLGLPAQDPAFAVTISAATQKLSVVFDDTFDWLDEDGAFLSIQMGLPHSASRNFFGGPWRHAGAVAGDNAIPPTSPDTDIDVAYTAIEGQRVVCRARIIRPDARISTHFTAAALIVTA